MAQLTWPDAQCPPGVKIDKVQTEHISSGLPLMS